MRPLLLCLKKEESIRDTYEYPQKLNAWIKINSILIMFVSYRGQTFTWDIFIFMLYFFRIVLCGSFYYCFRFFSSRFWRQVLLVEVTVFVTCDKNLIPFNLMTCSLNSIAFKTREFIYVHSESHLCWILTFLDRYTF